MVAWSIPGAALLITQLGLYPFSDVIEAYIVCGVVSAILGATGWLGKLLAAVPKPITAAVLAGVLFPFVIKVATAVAATPIVQVAWFWAIWSAAAGILATRSSSPWRSADSSL